MVKRGGGSRAYTLAEAMIAMAIVGVLGTVGIKLLTGAFQFFTQSAARSDVQRELRVILDNMDRTIRQASAASILVTEASGQPPYSKLTFSTVDGKSVVYSQSGRALIQTVGTNQTTLSNNLRYIAFTFPQTDVSTVMSISITLQKATFSGRGTALQMAITKVRVMNP